MALHPRIAADLALAAGKPPYWTLPLPQARSTAAAAYPARDPPVKVAQASDLVIPAAHHGSHDLPARLYRPTAAGRHPLVVFLHGSGFTLLSVETHDDLCRRICRASGCLVLSVEYRLAPEHPFPAGADDAWAALVWAHENRHALGASPQGLALAGDSAGACLAFVAALRAREAGAPGVDAIAAWYPVTDHPDNEERPSWREFANGYGLSADGMRWFWSNYLPRDAAPADPRISPLRADLHGLPPTWICTAEHDVLRDEGEEFAQRMRAAGVKAEAMRAEGMNHGFLKYADVIPAAGDAIEQAARWLAAHTCA